MNKAREAPKMESIPTSESGTTTDISHDNSEPGN